MTFRHHSPSALRQAAEAGDLNAATRIAQRRQTSVRECRNEYFIHAHIYAPIGMINHGSVGCGPGPVPVRGLAGCSPKKRMNSALASGPRGSV